MSLFKSISILALAALSLGVPTPDNLVQPPQELEDAGNHRRGVSYNNAKYVHHFTAPNSKVTWMYNWDSQDGGSSGMWYEFVAMLYADTPDHTNQWFGNVDTWVRAGPGTTHVLGFNEPDMCRPGAGGACMDLGRSIGAWHAWMEPLRKYGDKIILGSPAVTNQGGDNGLNYLRNFIKGCDGCQIDFVNIHWYDGADKLDYFKNHVRDAMKIAGNRPIWITEFGFTYGSEDQIKDFLSKALPWLDSQGQIHRYCMFMAKPGMLISNGGNGLSAIGQLYNTV